MADGSEQGAVFVPCRDIEIECCVVWERLTKENVGEPRGTSPGTSNVESARVCVGGGGVENLLLIRG